MYIDKCKFNAWGYWQWRIQSRVFLVGKLSVTALVIYFNDARCYFWQFTKNCIDNIYSTFFSTADFSDAFLQTLPPPFWILAYCFMPSSIWSTASFRWDRCFTCSGKKLWCLLHRKQHGLNNANPLWLQFFFSSKI